MNVELIKNRIFEIRGCKVMLDFHLAELYQVENRALKQAVRRNIERFPSDFMFELTKNEAENVIQEGISQFVIPPLYNTGISSIMAFLEPGVAMLSSILKSKIAIEININIIRAFIVIRQNLTISTKNTNLEGLSNEVKQLKEYIEEVFTDYNDINEDTRMQLELINETLAHMQATKQPSRLRSIKATKTTK